MTQPKFESGSPLPPAPHGGKLQAALLTSYRPVSPTFLLREVLPMLLQLGRESSEDKDSEALFVAEVVNALQQVPGKITVITSGAESEAPLSNVPWLSSYVQSFMVGRDADCIQHAKLWMFHWKTDDGEVLQITVSSTNLTSDAFHGQIQAGWTMLLPVAAAVTGTTSQHTVLRDFLGHLGGAAGCDSVTSGFADLLNRCSEVRGSHFITSVPGKPSNLPFLKSLTGRATTKRPARVRIMTPSIGKWHTEDGAHLREWCEAVGVPPHKVELIWPKADHKWVGAPTTLDEGMWKMPAATLPALRDAKVKLLAAPSGDDVNMFDAPPPGDRRWSHAKFYEFNNGLLLGSHNWSKSAWGLPNGMNPNNFELSVFVEKVSMPGHRALPLLLGDVALMSADQRRETGFWIAWAHASWDGTTLIFGYRLRGQCDAVAEWFDGDGWRNFSKDKKTGAGRQASERCTAPAPIAVRLSANGEDDARQVFSVTDIRPGSPAPIGVSPAQLELADDLWLESYGGPIAQAQGTSPRAKKGQTPAACDDADYTLDWLVGARQWRRVVDKWRSRSETLPANVAQADAIRLVSALRRRSTDEPGVVIAIEELELLSRKAGK